MWSADDARLTRGRLPLAVDRHGRRCSSSNALTTPPQLTPRLTRGRLPLAVDRHGRRCSSSNALTTPPQLTPRLTRGRLPLAVDMTAALLKQQRADYPAVCAAVCAVEVGSGAGCFTWMALSSDS